MKRLFVVLAAIAITGIVMLAGGWVWFQGQVQSPGPLTDETVVIIEPGSGLGSIAVTLLRSDIIDSDFVFRVHARLTGYASQLKAGEYAFEPGVSPGDVLAKIVAHDVVVRFVTIPEGLTSPQIIDLINAAEGLSGTLLEPVEDGALLPETYGYERGESRTALVRRMRLALDRSLSDLWASRAADLPLDSPQEALILASIVEKETSVAR